jgi:hypothetical protein
MHGGGINTVIVEDIGVQHGWQHTKVIEYDYDLSVLPLGVYNKMAVASDEKTLNHDAMGGHRTRGKGLRMVIFFGPENQALSLQAC